MLRPKNITIFIIFILPMILTACSFSIGPKNSGQVNGVKGVFKTVDLGASWQEKNIYEGSDKSLGRFNAKKMAFHINDTTKIYRGTEVGLFYSENSGDSWRLLNSLAVTDFVLNPKTEGLIYLISGREVYKTIDNGAKWQLIYSEVRSNVSLVSVAINYADTSYIYILTNDGILLMSADWGETWKTIQEFKVETKKIITSPGRAKTIFVGAEHGLYNSTDGGQTWQEIVHEKDKDYPGIKEFRDLKFSAKGKEMFYLSRYGLLKSRDYGTNWEKITLIAAPNTIEVHAFGFNPKNTSELYYLINNIFYHTVNNGRNWETTVVPVPGGAKVGELLVDPDKSEIMYLSVTQ